MGSKMAQFSVKPHSWGQIGGSTWRVANPEPEGAPSESLGSFATGRFAEDNSEFERARHLAAHERGGRGSAGPTGKPVRTVRTRARLKANEAALAAVHLDSADWAIMRTPFRSNGQGPRGALRVPLEELCRSTGLYANPIVRRLRGLRRGVLGGTYFDPRSSSLGLAGGASTPRETTCAESMPSAAPPNSQPSRP
jgi:hypothetical protein